MWMWMWIEKLKRHKKNRMGRYLLSIIFFSSVADAEIVAESKYSYYSVSSPSKRQLPRRLDKATPIKIRGKKFHGQAHSHLNWYFWWETKNGSCYITNVKVTVDTTFTLPTLENSNKIVQELWDRWFPYLLRHENGHRDNALRIAKMIEKGIYNLPGQKDCGVLEKNANELANYFIQELEHVDKVYDRKTNHGETEGAWIDSHVKR